MKKFYWALSISALVVVLSGWVFTRQGVLNLSSVEVEGADVELVREVQKTFVPHLGVNLLSLSLEKIQKQLSKDPRIETLRLRRRFPSAVHVQLVQKTPVAKVLRGIEEIAVNRFGKLEQKLVTKASMPIWVHFDEKDIEHNLKVARFINELRAETPKLYELVSEFGWLKNRGLVLNVLSTNKGEAIYLDLGTDNFSLKWKRMSVAVEWFYSNKVYVERIMALDNGQVVVSGVKNLHKLKNELNLKEIVRRATLGDGDNRAKAR